MSKGRAVMGTATSQIAAHVLVEHGLPAINATRFLQQYEPEAPAAGGHRLEPGTLLVFDEANMTSTDQLRRVQRVAERDRAKVLYFGDPRQLAAVGAGGGLELMARENGTVAELDQVVRFVEDWEREASVRLRAGDVSVLEEYTRRGRIHGGTAEDMEAAAVDRYVADVAAGYSSAVITATNADAARVSAVVQARLGELGLIGGEVVGEGMDGNMITIGDRIQWRENVYTVDSDNGQALVNREFLQVAGLDDRGRVRLVRETDGTEVYVPSEWLRERAVLGYAGTEHAYEGVTVDTAHALIPGYVAMTRGRLRNEAWLTTRAPADSHGEALQVSPVDLFEQAQSSELSSAMEYWRSEMEAERSTDTLAGVWEHVTRVALRDATLDTVGAVLGWDAADRISTEDGQRRLITALTRAELTGHDREAVLREAVESRSLDRVDDLAAVLAYRVERAMESRTPERQAATWSDRVAGIQSRGEVGAFVAELATRLDARVAELGERAAAEPPVWAREQLGPVPPDPGQAREWQRRAGLIAAYRERCGIADALPSVGPRPHDDDVAQLLAWRDAARAGGRPVDELTYQAYPDSTLEALRARWRRLADNAPAYVEPELAVAHDQQRQAEADATILRQAATLEPDEARRAELERQAEGYTRAAQIAAERVAVLQRAQDVRVAWLAAHEADQDAALEAERELKRRGRIPEGPQQEPEQTCLFELADEHGDAVDEKAERERQAAAQHEQEQEVALETAEEHAEHQAGLFAIEPAPVDVARQQTLAVDVGEDDATYTAVRDVLLGQGIIEHAQDIRQTLADIEVRTRYAEEMLARRVAEQERQAVAEQEAEQERARMVAAEAERAPERERAPEQVESGPVLEL